MPPQLILDDLTALDAAKTASLATHSALSALTDEQVALLNQVADATSKMQVADAAEKTALDKTIADITAEYTFATPAPGGASLMMAEDTGSGSVGDDPSPPTPRTGPLRALWAWVVANPDKALKLLSWLALLFGIPIPALKAKIEALPKKS